MKEGEPVKCVEMESGSYARCDARRDRDQDPLEFGYNVNSLS